MKRILFIFISIAAAQFAFAQPEFGINGFVASTWLFNNNVSDQAKILDYRSSFGGAFGLTANYFFTDKIGVGLEFNLAMQNQKYHGVIDPIDYDFEDKLHYFSIPILFKLKTEGGFYFEVGPQFSLLTSATGSGTYSPDPGGLLSYADRDIQTGLNGTVVGGVFGFGGRFDLTDQLAMTAGIRLSGSLSDVTTDLGDPEFENEFAEDHLGTAEYFAHLKQDLDYGYEKTSAVAGGIHIGLVYVISK